MLLQRGVTLLLVCLPVPIPRLLISVEVKSHAVVGR